MIFWLAVGTPTGLIFVYWSDWCIQVCFGLLIYCANVTGLLKTLFVVNRLSFSSNLFIVTGQYLFRLSVVSLSAITIRSYWCWSKSGVIAAINHWTGPRCVMHRSCSTHHCVICCRFRTGIDTTRTVCASCLAAQSHRTGKNLRNHFNCISLV